MKKILCLSLFLLLSLSPLLQAKMYPDRAAKNPTPTAVNTPQPAASLTAVTVTAQAGLLTGSKEASPAPEPTATDTPEETGAIIPKNIKIITTDGSIITGTLAGMTASEIFIETKKNKAATVKLKDIKAAFNADTGKEFSLANGAATAVSAAAQEEAPAIKKRADAGAKPRPEALKPAEQENKNGQNSFTELYFSMSLANSYAIGSPLQKWMNDDVQSGSPAFYNFGLTAFMQLEQDSPVMLGIGGSISMPPSHSIWGSELAYGYQRNLVLEPYIFTLDLPIRMAFKGSDFSLTVAPGLLIDYLSGHYYQNNAAVLIINGHTVNEVTCYTNMGSIGMGFGISASAEYYFGMFGVNLKAGMRILSSDLNFDSAFGPWSPVDSSGKTIGIDLGGTYATIGLMMKFGQ